MSEEIYSPGSDIESQWGSEGGNEVTAEDIARVQEWLGNARKAAAAKASSQKTTKQFALMLSFIFKYVEDERSLWYVYELMTNFKISTIAIFGHFLPTIQQHMDIAPYKPLYAEIWDNLDGYRANLTSIWEYYKELYAKFPQLRNIPDNLYLDMIMRQLKINNITTDIEQDALKEIREGLRGAVFVD